MKTTATSIIILAAGNSSRLGFPKQLLQSGNRSLLRNIAEKTLDVGTLEVITVLGFEADRMKQEIQDLRMRIEVNQEWEEGIASSIRAGIRSVPAHAEAALITLCDQPAVTAEHLSDLIASCSLRDPIAASRYGRDLGVPACFARSLFPELLLLRGDMGAKRIIMQDPKRVAVRPFPDAAIDIDNLEDYQRYRFRDEAPS